MTTENKPQGKKSFSLDWLVSGVLTKIGDTFDRLTGRGWNPSSSLATSKLIDKLKFLLDSEVKDLGKKGKFVPHVIKLKIQWDKFSTDSEEDLGKLEHELHAATIDHINDKLYHTYAPLNIEIKTDYFTDGVKMLSSFGKYADRENDEASINVTVPQMKVDDLITDGKISVNLTEQKTEFAEDIFIAKFESNNKVREIELNFTQDKRISVGRTSGNQISIDDKSVSKHHASLILNAEKKLMVADTGSTNGTFINGQRIAYGKAIMFEDTAILKFGVVNVKFERVKPIFEEDLGIDEEFEPANEEIKETQASINIPQTNAVKDTQLTQANLENDLENIKKTDLTLQMEKSKIIKPIKSETNAKSKTEEPKNEFEDEEFVSQPEIEKENNSEVMNLDNTQDWEI